MTCALIQICVRGWKNTSVFSLFFCVEENHSRVSQTRPPISMFMHYKETVLAHGPLKPPSPPLCSGSGQTRLQHCRQEAENWPHRFQAPHPQRGGHALVPAESKCPVKQCCLSQLKQFGFDNFFISWDYKHLRCCPSIVETKFSRF